MRWQAVLLFIVMAFACSQGVQAASQAARAPDTIATEFYTWYLDTLSADQDPLSDRYDRFTTYVAPELTKRLIDRLQRKPPPQTDYFLQASEYQPAWRKGVHAAVLRRDRASADVLVTLSGEDAPTQALLLTLALENGIWKIRRVAPAANLSAESSTEQLVI